MSDFIQKLIDNIPDYQQFLTVDEMDASSRKLAEEYPDLVTMFEAGRSRKGHPIYCLKIGQGSRNALMFGCPHPNEPMGAMLFEYFDLKEEGALIREAVDASLDANVRTPEIQVEGGAKYGTKEVGSWIVNYITEK